MMHAAAVVFILSLATPMPRAASGSARTLAGDARLDGYAPELADEQVVSEPDADASSHRVLKIAGIGGFTIAATALFGTLAWWRDESMAPFSLNHEGGFGRGTYAGGVDKMGHAYSWYAITRASDSIYGAFGFSKGESLALGAATAFMAGNFVEVADGFTSYGFDYGDVIANTAGIALAVVLELSPKLDSLIGFRISYAPTREYRRSRDFGYTKTVNDYGGMVFLLDLKLAGLAALLDRHPALVAYLNLSITYSAVGYEPSLARTQRNIGVSLNLNVSHILRTLLGDENRVAKAAQTVTDYYAVPFSGIGAAVDLNRRRRGVKIHWLFNDPGT